MTDSISSKKGQGVLGGLTNNVVGFGVFVMVLALIGIVLVEFQGTQETGGGVNETGIGYNITADGLDGIDTISGFSNVIAIVIIAGVVLALVGGFLLLR